MDNYRRTSTPLRPFSDLEIDLSRLISSLSPLHSSSASFSAFLRSIDQLFRHLESAADDRHSDSAFHLLHRSMSRLHSEFRSILSDDTLSSASLRPSLDPSDDEDDDLESIPVACPVDDYNVIIDAMPSCNIRDLGDAARRLTAAGYGKDCAASFGASRRGFVDESLSRLGITKDWNVDEVDRTAWGAIEHEILRWNQAIKVVFLILFPSERRLCDRVFPSDLAPVADLAFADSCHAAAIRMLSFAEAVASTGTKSPEKLFKMVDMYEVLRDLLSEIEFVFSDQHGEALVADFAACCAKLASTIRGILTEFDNMIRRDPVNQPQLGGDVHPITRYVINYLRAALAMWRTLEEVIEQEEDPIGGVTVTVDRLRQSSPLSAQIGWIMDHLNVNLEGKANAYVDEALRCVFLMNNGRYMIAKLEGSELQQLVGEQWVRGQMTRIGKWLTDYQRISWGKVVAALRLDNDGRKGSVEIARKKLKMFNAYLEDIYKKQKGWVAKDDWLRDEIRAAAFGAVLPAYRNFLAQAGREWGRQTEGYVKYTLEDVEDRIAELFDGSSAAKKL